MMRVAAGTTAGLSPAILLWTSPVTANTQRKETARARYLRFLIEVNEQRLIWRDVQVEAASV